MNSFVWAVWAELAVRKKSGFEFFWATFEGVFFNFLRAKKMNFFWKHCRKFPHFFDIFDDFVYCWTFEILHLHICLLLNLWDYALDYVSVYCWTFGIYLLLNLWDYLFASEPLNFFTAEPLRLCPGLCICLLLNLWEGSAVNKITKIFGYI